MRANAKTASGSTTENGVSADASVDDFIGGYLGYDERSRHALETSIRSLASGQGGAFFFNGVFGSGKSHLLGLLALLADGVGHGAFLRTHPHLAPALQHFPAPFVVHFSLDDYAANFSLEEIFWREVESEFGKSTQPFLVPVGGSRGEAFAALEEQLAQVGKSGFVLCVDELSLFLSGREHRALQQDAAFLQFLGQRARRRNASSPFWIFAALQKTVEDIGDLDSYAVSQIRDRYVTLPLSLAHLPSLLERRLVIRTDAEAVNHLLRDSYEAMLKALPRLDFGREEWDKLYPFNPATVSLLENVASRFLSRTRSAVLFCAQSIDLDAEAKQRVLPGALFDFLEPELASHPDLRPLATAWNQWTENENDVALDETEAGFLRSLMKALLLFKIAGASPSVLQLANAVALDAKLPGDGNYEYTRILLEKLRSHAPVAVERRDGEFADRYSLDFGARVGEMARRFTSNALHTLPPFDNRITRYALGCCRDESLPLATLQPAPIFVLWRNAPRGMSVEIVSSPPTPDVLANRLAALAAPGGEADFALFLAPPFSTPDSEDAETNAHERWRESLREAVQMLDERRWRGAVAWWLPREAAPDEWQMAREATAQNLLLSDPQLHDNKRGRAVLEHLKSGVAGRESAVARLAARLMREGTLSTGAGATVDAADLAGRDSWNATLEAILELALPKVFRLWPEVAPRLRVLTPSNAEALCLETLRRPASAPFLAASLERAARAIAEPLGVAKETQGRWKIEALRDELTQEITTLAADGITLAALEATLAKSEWGLNPDQTRIAVCALLRAGEIAAFDARGNQLQTGEIGMPLRRGVHTLRPGRLMEESAWDNLQKTVVLLTGESPGGRSFPSQEKARTVLVSWHEELTAQTELAGARLHQLRRALGHDTNLWSETEELRERISSLLHATNAEIDGAALLARVATLNADEIAPTLQRWNEVCASLESRQQMLLATHAFLVSPLLAAPPELADERTALLTRFAAGETILNDATLENETLSWREKYSRIY
ncbi:MAG TPA: DUF6079 family protein, partial [Abditibacteriaceae bacterium]